MAASDAADLPVAEAGQMKEIKHAGIIAGSIPLHARGFCEYDAGSQTL